jgi:hypothetical protein
MNPRSKKYYEHIKAEKDSKKDIAHKDEDDEQKGDQSNLRKNSATQDDTGGGNNSGKRIDDN